MKFKKTFSIFFIALILLNISIIFATQTHNNNISNFFRVHVVANSDSLDDQLLKYQVAKKLDEYIFSITKNSNSKEESKKIIELNIQNILNLCNNIINHEGYNYDIIAYIGKLEYDKKQKDDLYMSSGIYDSLKIVIGNGKGQNWWSLIYPTLPEQLMYEDTQNISEYTSKNTFENINDTKIEYSIYIVDWFKELFGKITK